MKLYKAFTVAVLLFIVWMFASMAEEILYPYYCECQLYRIELHYLNKEIETKTYKLPKGVHLQVICHSRKGNFGGCDLEYVKMGMKLSSGHWCDLVDGVNSFKLKKISAIKSEI